MVMRGLELRIAYPQRGFIFPWHSAAAPYRPIESRRAASASSAGILAPTRMSQRSLCGSMITSRKKWMWAMLNAIEIMAFVSLSVLQVISNGAGLYIARRKWTCPTLPP